MRRLLGRARVLGLGFIVAFVLAGSPVALSAEHPAAEQDAHGGGHGEGHAPSIDGKTLGLQLLNFAVLLFILIKFGGGAINKALVARHQQLKTDLAAAAEAKTMAEERLKKQELRMSSLEKEIQGIRAGIKQEAEAEKQRLIATAEERAKRIREETAFIIEQQVKEAEGVLRREASDAAVKIAEDLLRRAMDARDQQRMVESFVTDVAGSAAAAAPGAATRKVI